MFERNNLLIFAECPLSNPNAEQVSLISEITKRFIPSNEQDEETTNVNEWVLQGSGFYQIHSCMNHSCKPNCRAKTPCGLEDNAKGIKAFDLYKCCQEQSYNYPVHLFCSHYGSDRANQERIRD
jgi:hypothetical protein